MKFVSLDVETANSSYASICQIGIAVFENGQLKDTWVSLINPEEFFDARNIAVHGIQERDITNAPKLPEVYEKVREMLEGNIITHHMPFDKIAMGKAFEKYSLESFNGLWLDSAKVARKTWSEFASRGYGLKNVASSFNISFLHHDALEDAIASGKIVLKALEKHEISIQSLFEKVMLPVKAAKSSMKW